MKWLMGEILINLSIFYDRLQTNTLHIFDLITTDISYFYDRLKCSWINKRWVSHQAYYEIKRGN